MAEGKGEVNVENESTNTDNRETDTGDNGESGCVRNEQESEKEKEPFIEGAPHEDAGQDTRAPIDRGWAWVVLAACVFEIIIYGGIMRSFGVFFLQFQQRFKSNASETALMSMIQNIVLSISALFVMTVWLEKVSNRTSVAVGGILSFLGYIITAFTTDIKVFYLAQGVIGGIGVSMVFPPMMELLGVYFKKHRGLANSIYTGGGSLGGLIFPPIIIKLFEEYQFTGTMLIVSGLLLNILVSAALMRPMTFYTNPNGRNAIKENGDVNKKLSEDLVKNRTDHQLSRKETEISKIDNDTKNKSYSHEHCVNSSSSYNKKISNLKHLEFRRLQSHDPAASVENGQSSPLLHRVRAASVGNSRQRTMAENEVSGTYRNETGSHNKFVDVVSAISLSKNEIYVSGDGICGSFVDISYTPPGSTLQTNRLHNLSFKRVEKDKSNTDDSPSCGWSLSSYLVSTLARVFDLTLLRDPVFLIFLSLAFCSMSGVALTPVYYPPHARDIGVTNEQIGVIVSVLAAIDLVSRVVVGIITDREWLKRTTVLAICAFAIGTASHLVRFVKTFSSMMAFVAVESVFVGQYVSMFAVILIESIGAARFKKSLGFVTLVHGISIAIFFPITGLLRDTTGDYILSYHLMGSLSYISGVLAIILSIAHKRKVAKDARKQAADASKTDLEKNV